MMHIDLTLITFNCQIVVTRSKLIIAATFPPERHCRAGW
jgi:hypothetical protein